MNSDLLNFRRAANERVNRHGIRAFHIADNVILTEEFNVIRAATLFKLCTDSSCAHVDNGIGARLEAVFGLDGVFHGECTDGSSDVFS